MAAAAAKTAKGKPIVNFVRLEPILEIVRTAMWSGRLADEKPVSICLVAAQESAKTQSLLLYRDTETVRYFSDLTTNGILALKSDLESKRVRHIVLTDLVKIVSHGRYVSERTIQTIASLMEEGQSDTADAGGLVQWNNLPNAGVLMALTPDYFGARAGGWRKTGFLTRFLPVYFEYSDGTVAEIHERIRESLPLPPSQKLALPEKEMLVQLGDKHAKTIEQTAIVWGQRNQTYGFRFHRMLRSMVKAHALSHGRRAVVDKDILAVMDWQRFWNDGNPIKL